MDAETQQLEALATRSLAARGLQRAPGDLAFSHKGQVVTMTIERSVYRGHFVTLHDGRRPPQQFRAVGGGYDWNAIAAAIVEIAESRIRPAAHAPTPAEVKDQNRQLADELNTITGAGGESRLSIQPSTSAPGRVRVRLDEIDLDPVSVMQLYAAVGHALPNKGKRSR
ncbi:MAG TPA: hypothetical protein VMV45_12445 [Casimicrobiaceae bacterium]|nr:hypothetical protein [Casimicrobiaceae bacterium]